MVHALKETWRVLVPGGTLLDLRPRSARFKVEMLTPTDVVSVGTVDAYGAQSDDAAADGAARLMVEEGTFGFRKKTHFHVEFNFGTVGELASFAAESRRVECVTPSYAELETIFRDLSAKFGEVRLRYRRPMMLAVYHKPDPQNVPNKATLSVS